MASSTRSTRVPPTRATPAAREPAGSAHRPGASRQTIRQAGHRWVVRHPVATFFAWFFTVGQAFAFAPLVAERVYRVALPAETFVVASTLVGLLLPTVVITRLVDGPEGLRALGRRLLRVRVPLGWWALALLGVPVVTTGLMVALYGPPTEGSVAAVASAFVRGFLLQTALVLVTNNLWEEVAWTGFVQARLQERHSPMGAVLLASPLFALQHLSLIVDNAPLAAVLLMAIVIVVTIPFRALLGTAYNSTGSLLLVGVIHAASNGMTGGSNVDIGFLPRIYSGHFELIGLMHQLGTAILGIALVLATRGRLRFRHGAAPAARTAGAPAAAVHQPAAATARQNPVAPQPTEPVASSPRRTA